MFVAYYPPDIHVSQIIMAYCQKVAEATGSAVFVIDRAVNSVALAEAFDEQGLGLLCMLDDNEHAGLESFEATYVETLQDGTRVLPAGGSTITKWRGSALWHSFHGPP